jgi:8-oxo-dGTP pyrophosphatase MutT (NUDIX family)
MSTWPSIALARRHDAALRVPFGIDTPHGAVHVGSVARAHLQALARWQPWLQAQPQALHLACPAHERSARLAEVNAALREARLIHGWRDETYAVVTAPGAEPLALVERAASRFWGTLTFGAHCNAYVADPRGRPTHLWIARRSFTKPTDPGLLDNLIGGGVPHGQTPFQTLLREGFEEAGLEATQVAPAVPGAVIELRRDVPEGLQHEWLQVYDLRLAPEVVPANRDGEVADFACHPIDAALAIAASGEMTVDAELVTLDFALRHRLLEEEAMAPLRARLNALCRVPCSGGRGSA